MSSVVDVCNKALDKVGHGSITSLNDGSTAANLCLRNWETIRDEVLRVHPWNFAVKRTSLAPSTTAPDWGFTNAFPIPADSLRILEIKDSDAFNYQFENKNILSDESVLYIRYIYQVTDPNLYDSIFINVVANRLAVELCEPLTQSNTKKQSLLQDYELSLTRARNIDGQENPPASYVEDEWIKARY